VEIKFVIFHNIIILCLSLLIPAQLISETFQYLFFSGLLLHASINLWLVFFNYIFRRLLSCNAVFALGMRQIQEHLQLILVLLKLYL